MYMTTFISKTTPPLCHEWQRASNSSSHLIITRRASIIILIIIIVVKVTIIILILKCLWRRRWRACHRAIRRTQVFTWYNSSMNVSRQSSMRCSYTMIASRVAPPVDEEGVDVEGVEEVRGLAVFVNGCFDRSWVSLHLTVAASMTHITLKWRDLG